MTVLNKHKHGIPAGAVYIGRGSKWGNPYVIGQHGNRDQVVDLYEGALFSRLDSGTLTLKDIAALHGKDLVCFCAPHRCHGHVLEEAAAEAHRLIEQGETND
jgi:hypothetical protein